MQEVRHTHVTAGGDRPRHQVGIGAPLGVGPWIRRPALPPPQALRFRQCPSGRISLSVSHVSIRKVGELTESTCNCGPAAAVVPPRGTARAPPGPAGAGPHLLGRPAASRPPTAPPGTGPGLHWGLPAPPRRGSSGPGGGQRAGPALLSSGSWRGDLPGRHQPGHSGTQP